MTNTHNLLARLNNNDPGAIEEIFKEKYARLSIWARRIIDNEAEAEDIAQTSILKLQAIGYKFESLQHVDAFLTTTVRNACINYLRKNSREAARHEAVRSLMDPFQESGAVTKLEYNDLAKFIKTALRELSPQCRQVMELILFEDMAPKEVAKKLHIPVHQVNVQSFNGRQKLQEILKRRGFDFDLPTLLILFAINSLWLFTDPR